MLLAVIDTKLVPVWVVGILGVELVVVSLVHGFTVGLLLLLLLLVKLTKII